MSAIFERDAKGRIVKGGSTGGITKTSGQEPPHTLENLHPEKVADLIVSMAEDPGAGIAALARACGMKEKTAHQIIERMNRRYQPVMEEVKNLTSKQLADKMESKLPMLIDAIDGKVDDATLRDVAVMIGVLTEKRQLLRGEPTQIMTYGERENLDKLGPALLKELDRRGIIVDASFQEVPEVRTIAPEIPHDAGLSKTAAMEDRRANRAKNR